MEPNRSLSLGILLLLSLDFKLSYGTGGGLMNCPVIIQQLGNDTTWLPLTKESFNKSIRILVTKATAMSLESKITKKIVSFNLDKKGFLEHLEDGYQFQWENLSLGILGNRRESEGWYIVSLEENVQVQQFCIQLKLYEQVSTPEIKVLNKTQENGNGTCSLTVVCTVKRGDHVTYSWSNEAGKHLLSLANHSHLLNISLSSQDPDSIYNCTASNPVSSRSQSFDLSQECRRESSESQSWITTPTAASLGFVLLFIILVPIAVTLWKKQGQRSRCQPPVEEKGFTIYAQVQKSGPPEKKFGDSLTGQSPCTTIYVAATEPVPEPVQESNPTTVYASVTLPES
ncbi:signaling lymphocytic activation molecule isoform X2 [Microtus ochrogaster]|uniref:Signaling lymphocytic activation molecule isoform X2 n=1 Tax=Microtus ochrogaster TaxID=79684 RepID=A0ABM1AWN3_MICOH|nr:signaling lymphocytic activation molecule isoform X2 [Microtus ochrogaster]